MNKKEVFFRDKEECNEEFTHITGDITDPALKAIDELYGAADVLSIKNALKHQRILLALSIIGTLITMGFLLYDEAELHGLILACTVMILFLFYIRRKAHTLDCHRKYIEYRVLAETLRVQFFLSVAGVQKQVVDILPWFIRQGLPWIEDVLKSLPKMSSHERNPIINFWILDQRAYHNGALAKAENKKNRDNRTTRVVIVITIIAYLITLFFELFISTQNPGNVDVNAVRAILKIIVGTMSAVTLFTSSYYGKLSLTYTINDHKRMIALYDNAEREIARKGETEEILVDLAREFLIENSTWYSYQTKNKPDLVF
ncbi:hypothetical protein [uncultured Methanobrevibacter sp.]|uniref:hypothetical protein n=1 Tax=uncultured Methanobrevibacter sp. TaxID=253161 RepID=UPI0025EBB406|nr:hypothetical protein [uncultured Methanobrevibacter sp.]